MAERSERKAAPLTDAVPTGALKDAGQKLLGLLVQRAAETATERVSGLTDRLSSVSENGGSGLMNALRPGGERSDDDEDGSDGGGGLKAGLGNLMEKVKGAFGGGGGGQKKLKVTTIVENMDVGLPLRTTYDLWTQFADFPGFMKKVESVEQESDEKTNWKAQVFWSHRTWEATVLEQVPDSHIVWRSKGAKGHVDGAVTFTEIGRNLTRILLVLEYYPQGLFERTGNLWRAQGRRARLEFQHFGRHAMSNVLLKQDEVEGWRGEIRDSEVVRTHEEAIEAEEQEREERPADEDVEEIDEYADEEPAEPDEDVDEAEEADEGDADEADEDDGYPEDEYADEDEPAEQEPEPAGTRTRRRR